MKNFLSPFKLASKLLSRVEKLKKVKHAIELDKYKLV